LVVFVVVVVAGQVIFIRGGGAEEGGGGGRWRSTRDKWKITIRRSSRRRGQARVLYSNLWVVVVMTGGGPSSPLR
jgi:hypothetical protein